MEIFAFLAAAWWAILIALVLGGIWFIAWAINEKLGVGLVGSFLVFILAMFVMAGISSYTTVQRGTVGLVSRYGGLTNVVFRPGLNWKTPFIEGIEIFDTTQQAYEMSAHPDTSNAQWTDYTVGSQTSDGQTVDISATTIFRIPDGEAAVNIRQNIGITSEVVENVVKANVRSIARNTSKRYTAGQLYSGDITDFQEDVREQLETKFAEQGEGLVLVDFKVRGIKFEEKYSDAIEAKQIAAERIVTEENNANAAVFEARKTKELAIGEADATRERAKGEADAIKLEADANAYAIEAEGRALKKYDEILTLRFVENLNDKTLFLPSDAFQYLLPLPE
jgi:regulator of protease activity HflC (stomatin/prohibitin superfamily)